MTKKKKEENPENVVGPKKSKVANESKYNQSEADYVGDPPPTVKKRHPDGLWGDDSNSGY